jgi:hypothetical protein
LAQRKLALQIGNSVLGSRHRAVFRVSVEPDQDHPIPPPSAAATGQRAETLEDRKALIASPSLTSDFLERGLPSTLVGLSTTDSKVLLNQIGAASVLTIFDQQGRRIEELSTEVKAERNSRQENQVALSDMRSRADIAETRATDAEGTRVMRDVMLTVGGALLGIAGGGYDKLGLPFTLLLGAIAVLLIGSVVKSNPKRASK